MSVVAKVSRLLEIVASKDDPVTLSQLQAELEMPKSTVFRLASDLSEHGFLTKHLDGRYSLGLRLLYWGHRSSERHAVVGIATPLMTRLRDDCGESVHLYIRRHLSRVCIASVSSLHALRTFAQLGSELPLTRGASGKLLLAYAPHEIVSEVFAELGDDRVFAGWLRQELELIRETGVSISRGEREPGLSSVGVGLRGPHGEVVACLTVSGPSNRFDDEAIASAADSLKVTVKEIEERIAPLAPTDLTDDTEGG